MKNFKMTFVIDMQVSRHFVPVTSKALLLNHLEAADAIQLHTDL